MNDVNPVLRLDSLSKECAFTHEPADIMEHLEEEAIELLMALKRWKRGKGPLRDVIEEASDVRFEIKTFFELLKQYDLTTNEEIREIEDEKLDKFEAMLKAEKAKGFLGLVSRYTNHIYEFAKKTLGISN